MIAAQTSPEDDARAARPNGVILRKRLPDISTLKALALLPEADATALRCIPLFHTFEGPVAFGVVDARDEAALSAIRDRLPSGTEIIPVQMPEAEIDHRIKSSYHTMVSQPKALQFLTKSQCLMSDAVPLYLTNEQECVIGVPDPGDLEHVKRIVEQAKTRVRTVCLVLDDIKERTNISYQRTDEGATVSSGAQRLIADMFRVAVQKRASDVSIDPVSETEGEIAVAIEGNIEVWRRIPAEMTASIIESLLNRGDVVQAADRLSAHNGRLSLESDGRSLDLRFATMPTIFGTSMAIRLATGHDVIRTLEEAGMMGETLKRYMRVASYPEGMLIVAGPINHGKSSMLQTTLLFLARSMIERALKRPLRPDEPLDFRLLPKSFRSIEDPVETRLPWVRQTQIDKHGRITFEEAIEQFVRMNSHIMMVGEIRDAKSMRAAIEASLLGHLVFSTTHARDSIRALRRLRNKGANVEDIAAGIIGILSQRLIGRLCTNCRKPATRIDPGLDLLVKRHLPHMEYEPGLVYEAVGCSMCINGYMGRFGIFEFLEVTDEVEDAILNERPTRELIAADPGYRPMIADALERILRGDTTVAEAQNFIRWPSVA